MINNCLFTSSPRPGFDLGAPGFTENMDVSRTLIREYFCRSYFFYLYRNPAVLPSIHESSIARPIMN
eukprot:14732415-Ditylum_brightwellii.AAC.1